MFYNENMPLVAAQPVLKERRVKFTEQQLKEYDELSTQTGVPFAALVRMASEVFLPRMRNAGFTPNGIKAGYHQKKY